MTGRIFLVSVIGLLILIAACNQSGQSDRRPAGGNDSPRDSEARSTIALPDTGAGNTPGNVPADELSLDAIAHDELSDIAYDELDGSLYISSVTKGNIWRGVRQGDRAWEYTPFTVPHANMFGEPRGLLVDQSRRMLWALSADPNALYGFSLVTGKPMARLALHEGLRTQMLTDLCLSGDSLLLITATGSDEIYRCNLNSSPRRLLLFPKNIRFPDRIAFLSDLKRIVVAAEPNGLFEIDLQADEITRPNWNSAMPSDTITDLAPLSGGRLAFLYRNGEQSGMMTCTIDSAGTLVPPVRRERGLFDVYSEPLRCVVSSDSMFALVRIRRDIISTDGDTLQAGTIALKMADLRIPR